MKKKIILLLLFLSFWPIDGKCLSLTFDKLVNEDTAHPYLDQEVEIRGFLYEDASGEWLLSPLPNLQTCCLHKKQSCPIYLSRFSCSKPYGHAVSMQGTLIARSGKFYLDDPQLQAQSNLKLYSFFLALGGIGLLTAWSIKKFRK